MRILIVCKARFKLSELDFQKNRAYIYDQVKGLRNAGLAVDVFFVEGTGIASYISGAFKLRNFLRKHRYDVVHAHFGFTGLLVGVISKYPKVVTYHGTDITARMSNVVSLFSMILSNWNIFVSRKLYDKSIIKPKKRFSIFPCGVDLKVFYPIDQSLALEKLQWKPEKKRVLFSSFFSNAIKNVALARKSLEKTGRNDIEFIELKNKTREEVALMLNACDLLLLTSYSEGSSQITKEAVACNCPIVATDVGDIREFIGPSTNSYVTSFDADEIAAKITAVLDSNERSNGSVHIRYLSNDKIVTQLIEVYVKVMSGSKEKSKRDL